VCLEVDTEAGLATASGMSPWLGFALGLLLVTSNGFFVATEFALVTVRATELQPRAGKGARIALEILGHLDTYLSATQLGVTLSSLALGWVGEPAVARLLEPLVAQLPGASPTLLHSIGLTIAFICITVLHIVLGELAPKWIGIKNAASVAGWVAFPLYGFHKMTYPFNWALNQGATSVLRLVGIRPGTKGNLSQSEEELRLLLSTGVVGRLSKQKRELLDNVFELSHRSARQIMVPRADVIYLSTDRTLEENLGVARQAEFTRFPLCKKDLDQIVGMINIKDLFHTGELPSSLEAIKREIHYVPETLTLDRLLRRMRAEREHMVAVVDEYGGVAGIVTLEDVIEEIVGQIQDEFDQEKPDLVREGENVFRVAGTMLVADLEDALNIEFSERDEDTVGGVVLSEIGRQPHVGDVVRVGEVRFEVLEAGRRRINAVKLTIEPHGASDARA
jgi:magnesium and cobalt exporter, CNNM family